MHCSSLESGLLQDKSPSVKEKVYSVEGEGWTWGEGVADAGESVTPKGHTTWNRQIILNSYFFFCSKMTLDRRNFYEYFTLTGLFSLVWAKKE